MGLFVVRVQFVVMLMAFRMLWKTSYASDCSFYTLHDITTNWRTARLRCQANGGDLLSMETVKEYQFINKTIQSQNKGNNEWHIGLTKTRTGSWKWVSGYSLTIDKWQPNEPSGDSHGYCVIMAKNWPPGTRGLFNDLNCNIYRMFICEYKNEVNHTQGVLKFCPTVTTTERPTVTRSRRTNIITTMSNELTSLSMSHADPPATPEPLTEWTSRNASILSPDPQALGTSSPANAPEGFPTMLVAIVLGILLAVGICMFFVVFWWMKRKSGESKSKKKPWQSYAVSTPMAENRAYLTNQRNNTPGQAVGTEDMQLYAEPDVLYAEIADDYYLQPCDSFDSPAPSSTHSEVEYANSPSPSTPPTGYADLVQNPVYENHMPYQPLNKYPGEIEEDEIAV